jgi:pSer/pThr/pTyr-binding forkhead associated (FHA) protein
MTELAEALLQCATGKPIDLSVLSSEVKQEFRQTELKQKSLTMLLTPFTPSAFSHPDLSTAVKSTQSPRLEVLAADGTIGSVFPITVDETRIGRAAENTVFFEDSTGLSRYHARIRRENEQFIFEDMNSSNGSYVNGTRVFELVSLKDGDRLEIGNIHLIFRTSPVQLSSDTTN